MLMHKKHLNILITSGGTYVPIDQVRRITNMSSGRFGSAIATAALEGNHLVNFLYAKNSTTPFSYNGDISDITAIDRMEILSKIVRLHESYNKYQFRYCATSFRTFDEYASILKHSLLNIKPDVVILAAAVSDYAPKKSVGKISSDKQTLALEMKSLPKVIDIIKEVCPKTFLVGFKLLVNSSRDMLIEAAQNMIVRTNADMVVANDLDSIKNGNHTISIISSTGQYIKEFRALETNLAKELIQTIEKDIV